MVAQSVSLLALLASAASAQYAYQNTTSAVVTPSVSSYSAPVYPTASSSAPKDCEKVRSDCQSKPDANQSYCAALYVECSGTTSGLNKPPVPTTSVETTVYTTVCPATSYSTSGTKTFTSVYTTTSTITSCKGGCPSTYAPHPTSSAKPDCEKVRSDCQSKPDANQSYCAALYAQCAGTTSGLNKPPAETTVQTTVYTTVCPATTTYTKGTQTHTSTYITTSTITTCKGGCPSTYAPKPTTTPTYTCQEKFNRCRNGEDGGDRNQAFCAAEFAKCNGPSTSASKPASTHPAGTPSKPAETHPASTYPAGTPSKPAETHPASTKPAGTPSKPAETHPAASTGTASKPVATIPVTTVGKPTTMATATPSTVRAPSATTSQVLVTGAASSLKAGSIGLSGALAFAFFL